MNKGNKHNKFPYDKFLKVIQSEGFRLCTILCYRPPLWPSNQQPEYGPLFFFFFNLLLVYRSNKSFGGSEWFGFVPLETVL
jgi:hypothetical protein